MTGQARQPESASPASPEARHWLEMVAVERPVLELRPDYTALIIVADGLRPGPSDEATDALLIEAEAQARATLAGRGAEELAPVADWRLAKAGRTSPASWRCSIRAPGSAGAGSAAARRPTARRPTKPAAIRPHRMKP